jgi:two-component system NtrC family response regulator
LGGHEEISLDVRVLATSSTGLGALVDQGRFREDLFGRLSAIEIRLPPLRDRRQDIPLLIEHFTGDSGPPHAKLIHIAEARIGHCVDTYGWPGNVRELRDLIAGMQPRDHAASNRER